MIPFALDFTQSRITRVVPGSDVFLIQQQYQQMLADAELKTKQLVIIANTNNHAEYLYNLLKELNKPQHPRATLDLKLSRATNIRLCPDWGTLSYDQFNPSPAIVSDRIAFLHDLCSGQNGIYIISLPTALHRFAPVNFLYSETNYAVGQVISRTEVCQQLLDSGYRKVEVVYEPGEFTDVGRFIDFFPMGANAPYRLSFFEGEIERIRVIDVESQEIVSSVDNINISQGSEYPTNDAGINNFVNNFAKYFNNVELTANSIYNLISEGIIAQGSQYYLPLFFNNPLSILADYMPKAKTVQIINYSGYEVVAKAFRGENELRYRERIQNRAWPPVKVQDLYTTAKELFSRLKAEQHLITFEMYEDTLRHQAAQLHQNPQLRLEQLVDKPLAASAFMPLDNLMPSHLRNSIGNNVVSAQQNQDELAGTDINVNNGSNSNTVGTNSTNSSGETALSKLSPEQILSGASTSTNTNDNASAIASSTALSNPLVAHTKGMSELQRLVDLGLNRFEQPIVGKNSLNFLAKGNTLTFNNLIAPTIGEKDQFYKLATFLRKVRANFNHVHIVVTVSNSGRMNSFLDLIDGLPLKFEFAQEFESPLDAFTQYWQGTVNHEYDYKGFNCRFIVCSLKNGFVYYDESKDTAFVILSEQDIIGSYVTRERRIARNRQQNSSQAIQNLLELRPGQLLVHQMYGICQYVGLKNMEVTQGVSEDFIELTFADISMYLPVHDIHLVSIFSHQVTNVVDRSKLSSVSKGGAKRWLKQREKAMEAIHDMAAELLEVQSRREVEQGFKFVIYEQDYQEFCSHFKYEETPDQYATIHAVLQDMSSERKMERLICGDVGFGKTEVAMRAAFVAINNGKQVALLVPTTLLAQQHYESFRDRFAYTGAQIELLTSFNSTKKTKDIWQRIEKGLVDIVIGTHGILSNPQMFKNLGLLIIDEEHQFGVKQKEMIKGVKASIDVLTMTATPIPRTLNMALQGFKDISLITTPPANRLSIITKMIGRDDSAIIKDAINREILRGGQVFFIHNDINSQPFVVNALKELVPHARITYANGQMSKVQLEDAMMGFHNQRYNILVCSTIIETGIDVPNANTIIVNNAQNFGMAQLHQLRGRVGRSFRQAYAYFTVPNVNKLSQDAQMRLNSLISIDSLGAGYILATHDLEIRGAGEILGESQSGKVDTIGYSLYMSMLRNAVKMLRQHKALSVDNLVDKRTKIDLAISTIIPSTYMQAANLRVYFYRQISNAISELQLDEIANNMIERFGDLPASVRALFMISKLRLRLLDLDIEEIRSNGRNLTITFSSFEYAKVQTMIDLVKKYPQQFSASKSSFLVKQLPANAFDQIKLLARILNNVIDFGKVEAEREALARADQKYQSSINANDNMDYSDIEMSKSRSAYRKEETVIANAEIEDSDESNNSDLVNHQDQTSQDKIQDQNQDQNQDLVQDQVPAKADEQDLEINDKGINNKDVNTTDTLGTSISSLTTDTTVATTKAKKKVSNEQVLESLKAELSIKTISTNAAVSGQATEQALKTTPKRKLSFSHSDEAVTETTTAKPTTLAQAARSQKAKAKVTAESSDSVTEQSASTTSKTYLSAETKAHQDAQKQSLAQLAQIIFAEDERSDNDYGLEQDLDVQNLHRDSTNSLADSLDQQEVQDSVEINPELAQAYAHEKELARQQARKNGNKLTEQDLKILHDAARAAQLQAKSTKANDSTAPDEENEPSENALEVLSKVEANTSTIDDNNDFSSDLEPSALRFANQRLMTVEDYLAIVPLNKHRQLLALILDPATGKIKPAYRGLSLNRLSKEKLGKDITDTTKARRALRSYANKLDQDIVEQLTEYEEEYFKDQALLAQERLDQQDERDSTLQKLILKYNEQEQKIAQARSQKLAQQSQSSLDQRVKALEESIKAKSAKGFDMDRALAELVQHRKQAELQAQVTKKAKASASTSDVDKAAQELIASAKKVVRPRGRPRKNKE